MKDIIKWYFPLFFFFLLLVLLQWDDSFERKNEIQKYMCIGLVLYYAQIHITYGFILCVLCIFYFQYIDFLSKTSLESFKHVDSDSSSDRIDSNNNNIPLHLFQTWIDVPLPPKMKECVEVLKKTNPEFEYHFYNDTECREFIMKHYEKDILKAYDLLIPTAYKADLWRYCVLYKYGGIYLDIKFMPVNGFKLIELINKEYFVKDVLHSKRGIYNAFMVCKPNCPRMMYCIRQIVKNVESHFYGKSSLEPTGPLLLKKAFTRGEIEDLELSLTQESDTFYISYKETPILIQYPEYRKEQKKYGKGKHYNESWLMKKIYKNIAVLSNDSEKEIPREVILYCENKKWLSSKESKNIDRFRKKNADIIFHLFDNTECRSFLLQYYDATIISAYDSILDPVMKMELWKCCALYKYGGMYLNTDLNWNPEIEWTDLLDTETWVSYSSNPKEIYTGFLICSKNDKRFMDTIKKIVKLVKSSQLNETIGMILYSTFSKGSMEFISYKYEEENQKKQIRHKTTNEIILYSGGI